MSFTLLCERPWLVVRFAAMQRIASWSLNRPGLVDGACVAFREVRAEELAADIDAAGWFAARLAEAGLGEAVGLVTARNVARFVRTHASVEGVSADCVITLGLNNGEHVGTRLAADEVFAAGTINILCAVSVPLGDAALLEAASLVTQARTVALVEAGYRRPGAAGIVTGTGTDCVAVAAPKLETGLPDAGPAGAAQPFAGMHTAVGEAIGRCVLDATRQAAAAWIAERAG